MDLIRDILLHVEEFDALGEGPESDSIVERYGAAAIWNHAYLLVEQRLLGAQKDEKTERIVKFRGLTPDGYDFLELSRDEKVWSQVKRHIEEHGGGAIFAVWLELLWIIQRERLGLPEKAGGPL